MKIDTAFAEIATARIGAVFVARGGFFGSRRLQFAALATRYWIPATYSGRDYVVGGGLMSYGTDLVDMFREVGTYTGQILKGTRPADLPVVQFAINMHTARALGIEVPPGILASANVVIE